MLTLLPLPVVTFHFFIITFPYAIRFKCVLPDLVRFSVVACNRSGQIWMIHVNIYYRFDTLFACLLQVHCLSTTFSLALQGLLGPRQSGFSTFNQHPKIAWTEVEYGDIGLKFVGFEGRSYSSGDALGTTYIANVIVIVFTTVICITVFFFCVCTYICGESGQRLSTPLLLVYRIE